MASAGIQFCKVTAADVSTLLRVAKETFITAFAADNNPDDFAAYVDTFFTEEKLLEELNNPQSQFYFAMIDGTVAGYIKLNIGTAQTELKEDAGAELERIYVLERYQGLKVGKLLFEKSIAIARGLGKQYLWLGVWEHNAKAIRFYEAQGMAPFSKHIFMVGNDPQTDIMMKMAV